MILWKLPLVLIAMLLAACAGPVRHTPVLDAPATSVDAVPPAPPARNLLQEAGDTTWRVVTAPARVVSPLIPSKPAATKKEVESYDPPAVQFIPRKDDD